MQGGDWRLQNVGRPDEMHLVHAAAFLVAIVVIFILLKLGLAGPDNRRSRR